MLSNDEKLKRNREANRRWCAENRERRNAQCRKWRARKKQDKEWYALHLEKNRARNMKRRDNPEVREREAAQQRRWRVENPEAYEEQKKHIYAKSRTREGRVKRRLFYAKSRARAECKAVDSLRASLRYALKCAGVAKMAKTEDIVGYPMSEFVAWAKANNYNPPKTHIDHIVPVKWWLDRYPDDFVRAMRGAWNLANLRVISAEENLAKGAKRECLI